MGKKAVREPEDEGKGKKRRKKRKGSRAPVEEALACPPSAKLFYELVVGNGIGEDAVADALQAYGRALESRREKTLAAAQQHMHEFGKNCGSEHLILGPLSSPQQWRIEEDDPQRATIWSWVAYQSVHFCRAKK